jgi:hypothetical protein
MKAIPLGDLRRLLTSRAHRLGKPHRTFGPLTPSVTRRSRRTCAPDARLRAVRQAVRPSAPDPDLAAFRFKDDGAFVTRTPSAGSIFLPRGRSRLARARLLQFCPRSSRTLVTHRESIPVVNERSPREAAPPATAPSAPPRLAFRLAASSSSMRRVRAARSGKDAPLQHLQPTLRHEHSTDRVTLGARARPV